MNVRAALAAGAVRLAAAGVPAPARDVRRLMAEALGVEAGRLTLMVADPLPTAAGEAFERMLDERVRRRPVATRRVLSATGAVGYPLQRPPTPPPAGRENPWGMG